MTDKVIDSPLNGGLCYVTPLNETKNSYFCFSTGFKTNDLMVEGDRVVGAVTQVGLRFRARARRLRRARTRL